MGAAGPESVDDAVDERCDEQGAEEGVAPAYAASPLVVVGVGASAGGLVAFTSLLRALPIDTGMAFVLVQHLDPMHDSELANLLGSATRLPVADATEGLRLEPDHVYVITPTVDLALDGTTFRLTPRDASPGPRVTIDRFFRSLAAARGPRAIGIVLSGTGSDGALGIAHIKAAGGITFAQDRRSAEAGDMPANAIDSGSVDFVLSPDDIARELARIAAHPYLDAPRTTLHDAIADQDPEFRAVLAVLLETSGLDFAGYRTTTIKRRLLRRMAIVGADSLEAYLAVLRASPDEAVALVRDVLIDVTNFFRDAPVFAALRQSVLPALMRDHPPGSPIRVWVAGCSTGPEAYSLAIELIELIELEPVPSPLQIFATDISERSLAIARAGLYPRGIAADVPIERLRRHFTEEVDGWRIRKSIRDLCVFARHDVTADVPFSRMDLVSCRNLLIYLSPALQDRILPAFHHALLPGGYLLLGAAETIGRSSTAFETVDQRHRIYRRQPGSSTPGIVLGVARAGRPAAATASRASPTLGDLQRAADRLALGAYAPPGLLVDDRLDIVQFRGDTSAYLEPAPGQASLNILRMVARDLASAVGDAIEEARREQMRARRDGVRLLRTGNAERVTIEAMPVRLPGSSKDCFLVVFAPAASQEATPTTPSVAGDSREASRLRLELASVNGYLQSMVEENNAINDRLSEATEQAISANEELRCTNEEVQTAKEELESTNEELNTINEELAARNQQLAVANNDLVNLLDGIDLPVVMVDAELRIRRFTLAGQRGLRLIPADIGSGLAVMGLDVRADDIEAILREVMAERAPREIEVRGRDGGWRALRMTPYLVDGSVDGAVLTLTDIDGLKRSQDVLRESGDYARGIVDTVPDPLLVLNRDMAIETANPSFLRTFRLDAATAIGRRLFDLSGGEWDIPQLRGLITTVIGDVPSQDIEFTHAFASFGTRTLRVRALRLVGVDQRERKLVIVIVDITERTRVARLLEEASEELRRSNQELVHFATVASHDLQEPLRMVSGYLGLLRKHCGAALDERARGYVATAIDGTRRMSELIKAILEYSRLDSRKLVVGDVDLTAALGIAFGNVERRIHNVHASIEVGRLPVVAGDAILLTQLFQNLVVNAIKFRAAERAPRVIVAVAREDDDEWVVSVADNGIGIAAEDQSRIFVIFERLDHGVRDAGSTGVGLATCRRIAERHGGRIWVESTLGIGSTFFVALPKQPRL